MQCSTPQSVFSIFTSSWRYVQKICITVLMRCSVVQRGIPVSLSAVNVLSRRWRVEIRLKPAGKPYRSHITAQCVALCDSQRLRMTLVRIIQVWRSASQHRFYLASTVTKMFNCAYWAFTADWNRQSGRRPQGSKLTGKMAHNQVSYRYRHVVSVSQTPHMGGVIIDLYGGRRLVESMTWIPPSRTRFNTDR